MRLIGEASVGSAGAVKDAPMRAHSSPLRSRLHGCLEHHAAAIVLALLDAGCAERIEVRHRNGSVEVLILLGPPGLLSTPLPPLQVSGQWFSDPEERMYAAAVADAARGRTAVGKNLVTASGLADDREAQALIRNLVRRGCLIQAGRKGGYAPSRATLSDLAS